MVETCTPIVDNKFSAPDFNLMNVDGTYYNLEQLKGENGTVIVFMCNHCPYVQSILNKIKRDGIELETLGIRTIAISSNDTVKYPQDSYRNMKLLHENKGLPFPYLFDKDQSVAQSYGAVCTPDFFGFNSDMFLRYRGRLDESTTVSIAGTARELFNAMKLVAKTSNGPLKQNPSKGCSIKWK